MSTLMVDSRWSDIERAPQAPLRATVAKWLLARISRRVPVSIHLPGRPLQSQTPALEVRSPKFFHRLGADLKIGLGESYMAGEWRPAPGSDLADVLTPFAERLLDIVPGWLRAFRRLIEPAHPKAERNHREGARSNISRHYDLSNDLFALFLDETMTYSSAWFEGDRELATFSDLAAAQRRKVDGVLDMAAVGAGSRVLEIGTGWGQLAIQAAQRGAIVHSITLSQEQLEFAQARVDALGLGDRITLELRDYRDVVGQYDAVVSVEMIEAVGAEYWEQYFAVVGKLLVPGGRFGLQAITMPHDRMVASRRAYTWIHKYIFPGGLIPSPEAVRSNAERAGNLRVIDEREFGLDYARTLRLWRERFNARHDEVHALGFDRTFMRMWEFYLAYSEAGFRARHLDVRQYALEKAL